MVDDPLPCHRVLAEIPRVAALAAAGEDHPAPPGSIHIAAVEPARAGGVDEAGGRFVTRVGDPGGRNVHHPHASRPRTQKTHRSDS